jgi:hypothetical protein
MGDSGLKQRLAATLAADAFGYSRLMDSDEYTTSKRVQVGCRDAAMIGRMTSRPGQRLRNPEPA